MAKANPCTMFHGATGGLVFFMIYLSIVLYSDLTQYLAVWPEYTCTPVNSFVLLERGNTYWVYVPVEASNGTTRFPSKVHPFRSRIQYFYDNEAAETWGKMYQSKQSASQIDGNSTFGLGVTPPYSYPCYIDAGDYENLYATVQDQPDARSLHRIIGWCAILFVFLLSILMLSGACGFFTKMYLSHFVGERRSILGNKNGYGSI